MLAAPKISDHTLLLLLSLWIRIQKMITRCKCFDIVTAVKNTNMYTVDINNNMGYGIKTDMYATV